MRPMLVEVALVLCQDLSQVPLTMDQKVIEAFVSELAHEPLGDAFARGERGGVLRVCTSAPASASLKSSAEFAITVADQEPKPVGSLAQVHQQVARLVRGPGTGRMSRETNDVPAPRFDIHDEQHVRAEAGRVPPRAWGLVGVDRRT